MDVRVSETNMLDAPALTCWLRGPFLALAADGLLRNELHKRLSIAERLRAAKIMGIILPVHIIDVRVVHWHHGVVWRKPWFQLERMKMRPNIHLSVKVETDSMICNSILSKTINILRQL